jgi:hypothetical protein
MSADIPFQKISSQQQQGLRVESLGAQITKETSVVDGGRRDLVYRPERIDLNRPFKSTVKIMRSMIMLH